MSTENWAINQFVWGNWLGKSYPGIIIEKRDGDEKKSRNKQKQKVYWLGDRNRYSMLSESRIYDFAANFLRFYPEMKRTSELDKIINLIIELAMEDDSSHKRLDNIEWAYINMSNINKLSANDKFYDRLHAQNQNVYNSDDEFDKMSDSDESYTTGVGGEERKGTVHKLYHVSTDLRPIHSDDGYDSEVELDPYWLNDYITTHNDEFQDLNNGEKIIMESWSIYKKKHPCAAGKQLLETCVDWLESEGEKIVQSGSINNCITHFVRMMKRNELNTDELEDLISLLRDTYRRVNTTKSTQPIIACSNPSTCILENERAVGETKKCSSSDNSGTTSKSHEQSEMINSAQSTSIQPAKKIVTAYEQKRKANEGNKGKRRRLNEEKFNKEAKLSLSKRYFDVSCGHAIGRLYIDKFGSGSKGKSIQLNSGIFVTPAEFQKMGGLRGCQYMDSIRFCHRTLRHLVELKFLRQLHSMHCKCVVCSDGHTNEPPVVLRKRLINNSKDDDMNGEQSKNVQPQIISSDIISEEPEPKRPRASVESPPVLSPNITTSPNDCQSTSFAMRPANDIPAVLPVVDGPQILDTFCNQLFSNEMAKISANQVTTQEQIIVDSAKQPDVVMNNADVGDGNRISTNQTLETDHVITNQRSTEQLVREDEKIDSGRQNIVNATFGDVLDDDGAASNNQMAVQNLLNPTERNVQGQHEPQQIVEAVQTKPVNLLTSRPQKLVRNKVPRWKRKYMKLNREATSCKWKLTNALSHVGKLKTENNQLDEAYNGLLKKSESLKQQHTQEIAHLQKELEMTKHKLSNTLSTVTRMESESQKTEFTLNKMTNDMSSLEQSHKVELENLKIQLEQEKNQRNDLEVRHFEDVSKLYNIEQQLKENEQELELSENSGQRVKESNEKLSDEIMQLKTQLTEIQELYHRLNVSSEETRAKYQADENDKLKLKLKCEQVKSENSRLLNALESERSDVCKTRTIFEETNEKLQTLVFKFKEELQMAIVKSKKFEQEYTHLETKVVQLEDQIAKDTDEKQNLVKEKAAAVAESSKKDTEHLTEIEKLKSQISALQAEKRSLVAEKNKFIGERTVKREIITFWSPPTCVSSSTAGRLIPVIKLE